MGLFPEVYNFPVSILLKLWMAENFVQNSATDNLEEAYTNFLDDLVSKSLVMISKWRDNGEIKYCTLHDVVREFCLRKVAKEKFMQLIVLLIRVLDLLNVLLEGRFWARAMQAVTHLRYLAIYTYEFSFQWVSHLLDLQTLRVGWAIELSSRISPKLRHVDIKEFQFVWEDNDRSSSGDFQILNNSNSSLLNRLPTPEFDMPNLEELPLQSLEVGFSHFPIMPHYGIGRGDYCLVFPSNLKDLSLHRIVLIENVASNIARLRNLERLKLRLIGFKDEDIKCWDVGDYKFPTLKYFNLRRVNMDEWCSSEASFPVLEKLVIRRCEYLQEIPSSFADIQTLKLIRLWGCKKSVEDSALNIKKEVEDITGCDSLQVQLDFKDMPRGDDWYLFKTDIY
uniref:Late blight resistance protein homolog R1B-23 n=1 Tax=Nicotiana tabacum TaxID=4097 RepID=A0A1S4DP74_TOBAC|nr:PREDICTED: putative late blight resistance protein homolog R1B-23 [Nicotiana tabacum]